MKTFRLTFSLTFPLFFLLALGAVDGVQAQTSGGAFEIRRLVVASGGGNSAGGVFTLGGTAGQPSAGNLSAGGFDLQGGFWASPLAPTAARVALAGRVQTADGAGIRNVNVTLTDSRGAVRAVATGSFGSYRFENVEVGETYVLTVTAKKCVFAVPARVVSVTDELTDLDFTAEP